MPHPQTYNEQELLLRIADGDERAFKDLFYQFSGPLCYFANQLIDNKKEAEDITLSVLTKLWEKRTDFDNIYSVRSFLYVSAKNRCLDYLKHIHRKTAAQKELLYLTEERPDYLESKVIGADLIQKIVAEINLLPEMPGKLLKLSLLEGLSNAELAAQLSITVNYVRVQKSKAIQLLRSSLLKKKLTLVAFAIFLLRK